MDIIGKMQALGINPQIVNPADLLPYPKNYNIHPQQQLDEIGKGLRQSQKQYKNIVTWHGQILCGHGLVEAAIRAGKNEIIVNDRSDLTQSEAESLLISDNALPYLALPDTEKLQDLLDGLEQTEIPGATDDWLNSVNISIADDISINDPLFVDNIKTECIIKVICDDYTEYEQAVKHIGKKITYSELLGLLK